MVAEEFETTLSEIQHHLARLGAHDVNVRLTADFEPEAGTLVRVDYQGAYWHLLPTRLLELIAELPTGSGGESVRRVIAQQGHGIWHGPSPAESRDTLT
jgi:hypothetical protein